MPNSPDVYVHRIGRTGRVGPHRPRDHADHAEAARDLEAIERHANTEIGAVGRGCARRAAAEARAPEREARRPRHTKPRDAARARARSCIVGAGLPQRARARRRDRRDRRPLAPRRRGRPNVRVLERFSFAEVPAERAEEVVEKCPETTSEA